MIQLYCSWVCASRKLEVSWFSSTAPGCASRKNLSLQTTEIMHIPFIVPQFTVLRPAISMDVYQQRDE